MHREAARHRAVVQAGRLPKLNFFRAGTLLIPSGPAGDPDRMRLPVICTDPDLKGPQILVSVSTFEKGDDATCILLPKQHP